VSRGCGGRGGTEDPVWWSSRYTERPWCGGGGIGADSDTTRAFTLFCRKNKKSVFRSRHARSVLGIIIYFQTREHVTRLSFIVFVNWFFYERKYVTVRRGMMSCVFPYTHDAPHYIRTKHIYIYIVTTQCTATMYNRDVGPIYGTLAPNFNGTRTIRKQYSLKCYT